MQGGGPAQQHSLLATTTACYRIGPEWGRGRAGCSRSARFCSGAMPSGRRRYCAAVWERGHSRRKSSICENICDGSHSIAVLYPVSMGVAETAPPTTQGSNLGSAAGWPAPLRCAPPMLAAAACAVRLQRWSGCMCGEAVKKKTPTTRLLAGPHSPPLHIGPDFPVAFVATSSI